MYSQQITAQNNEDGIPGPKRKRRRRAALVGLGLLVTSCCVFGGLVRRALGPFVDFETLVRLQPRSDYCIEDVTIFPGDSIGLVPHQVVLISGDRIVSVEPLSSGPCPHEATRIAGAGRTLLPGFVDAHVHLMAPSGVPWSPSPPAPEHHLQAWLAAGVTTVFDLGGPSGMLDDLADEVDSGVIVGPHIVHGDTAFTVPGGHPIPAGEQLARFPLSLLVQFGARVIEDERQIPAQVEELHALGAPYIKIIRDRLPESAPEIQDATLTALVHEAHRRQLLAFVHVGDERAVAVSLEAGADLIAHLPYRGEPHLYPEIAGTRLTPTLHGFEVTVALARGEFVPGPLDRALHPSVLLDPLTGAQGSHFRDYPVLAQFATTLEREQASWPERITRLREAGAQILVGTDAPLPGVLPGSGYHSEIRALSRAGVPTEEIFAGATWGAATLLQPSPDFGAVREGLRADLVLVEGDPLADPSRSADLAEVFVSGRRVERTLLD